MTEQVDVGLDLLITSRAVRLATEIERFRLAYGEAALARAQELATTTLMGWENAMAAVIAEKMAVAARDFTQAQAELITAAGISVEAMQALKWSFARMVPRRKWRRKPARSRRRHFQRRGWSS